MVRDTSVSHHWRVPLQRVVQAGSTNTGNPMLKNIPQTMTTSTTNKELGKYISQAEAARIIGIARQTVANLVRRGRFTTKALAGRNFVLRSEAESFLARTIGHPSKETQARTTPLKKPLEKIDRRDLGKYILQAEAARIRGVSQQAIANLIRRRRLATVSVAGRTLVLRSEVEAFVPQPRTGRPPKRKTGTKAPKAKRSK